MRFIPGCLLLLLLVCSLSPVHGVLESPYARFRCQCNRVTYRMPRLGLIQRIKSFPPGNGCPRLEIIIWLKNKSVVCLDSKHPGIFKFLETIKRRHGRLGKSTPAQRT